MTAKRAIGVLLYHGNYVLVTFCFLAFLAAQTTRQVSDFWVRWWVEDKYQKFDYTTVSGKKSVVYPNDAATLFYSLFYGLIVFVFWLMMVLRGSSFLGFMLRGGERMRKLALHK